MESTHFTVGSWIVKNNRRGLIEAVLTCKCRYADKGLRIAWEDGSVSVDWPFALNRNGLHH